MKTLHDLVKELKASSVFWYNSGHEIVGRAFRDHADQLEKAIEGKVVDKKSGHLPDSLNCPKCDYLIFLPSPDKPNKAGV